MAKINKEEYEILKGLDERWKWIARDKSMNLWGYPEKPSKQEWYSQWIEVNGDGIKLISPAGFQFIQWEDESPYNIQDLVDEYESEYHIENAKIVNIDASKLTPWTPNPLDFESEETEVKKDIEWLKGKIERLKEIDLDNWKRAEPNSKIQSHFYGSMAAIDKALDFLDQLDEPDPKNISLRDVTHRLWELPLNDRKYWLKQLNDEFQEGYIVPLGLKTTDGKEQYLTYNGSYFACRRNKHLQQTFATLEEIPEFYRDLAERVL